MEEARRQAGREHLRAIQHARRFATLKEIGSYIGVSRERVRQLETLAAIRESQPDPVNRVSDLSISQMVDKRFVRRVLAQMILIKEPKDHVEDLNKLARLKLVRLVVWEMSKGFGGEV
jgi:hypothetical protein